MQSVSTRRFAHVPLAAIIVAAVGLVGGMVSLGVTNNLPWQSEGSASVQVTTSSSEGSLIKGARSTGQGDGMIGPGTTMSAGRPMIAAAPGTGSGEGLIGPDVSLYRPSGGLSMDRADGLRDYSSRPSVGQPDVNSSIVPGLGEGYIGPGASPLPSLREPATSNPNDAIERSYGDIGFTDESTVSSDEMIHQPEGTPR